MGRSAASGRLGAPRVGRSRSAALRFVLGLLPAPITLILQVTFWPLIRPFGLFLFVMAVFFSSWVGGLYAGVISTLVATIAAYYYFVPPERAWALPEQRHLWVLALFVALGVMLSVFHDRFKKANHALGLANAQLQRANDEVRRLYEKTKEIDQLKTHLFARVSHELRTPLTLVLGPVERLAAGGTDGALRDDLTLVARNARTLVRYVDDLLEVAKLSAGRVEPEYTATDLPRLLRFAASHFELAARAKRMSYDVQAPEELWAEVDPARLQRVLLNLLSNAFKFTPEGGRIRVSLSVDDARERVLVEVADSGPGVPPDERELVFEAYRQRRGQARQLFGGTGLGLCIARELVTLHGGSIGLAEAPEGGALFVVELPRRAPPGTKVRPASTDAPALASAAEARPFVEEVQPGPPAPADVAGPAGGALVLIVEDNPDMSATLRSALQRDYRVASAFDGKEGFRKALELSPDLVLTDIMMPKLSGEDLVRALRAHPQLSETPIIVLTALADDEARVRLLRAGARDYLTKPFRVEELHARVESAIAQRRAGRQIRALGERLQAFVSANAVVSEAVANLPRESIEGVLQTIAAQAQRLTCAEYVAIGQGTKAEKPFDPWLFVGVSPERAAAIGRHPRAVGTLGLVVQGGEAVCLRDVTRHPAFKGFPAGHPPMSSFLGVPIRFRERVVGHLYLTNKRGGEEFTNEDKLLVEMLAARAGTALETARLYEAERHERAWLEAVIEQMPDPVRVLDAQGNVAALNRAALALRCHEDGRRDPFGNPIDLDLYLPSGERLSPEEFPGVRALTHGEPTIGVDLRIRTADGGLLPVLASAVPVRSPRGAPLGATAIYRDVSALVELERMRTEWSALIAHDLRQPVGVVALAVAMARKAHQGTMAEAEAKHLDRIEGAARRLSIMIDELLDATRLEARRLTLAPALVDVAALAREVCERTANVTAGHSVSVREAGVPREVWADPTRVEQVMANLLSNAAKYGAPGTEIRVDVHGSDERVEVTITNHGPGIEPEELARLFQRFMRSRTGAQKDASGIGLGLYICKGLVQAHGGQIWAESTPGETTSFHFTLPSTPPTEATTPRDEG
jgi:signal transduction histidine kinase/DNA-binding response OmpR family regulator